MYYDDFVKHGCVLIERDESYLAHFGTKGMKWGVRRYQNLDGSLTPEGKKRYDRLMKKAKTKTENIKNRLYIGAYNETADKFNNGLIKKYNDEWVKKHGQDSFDDPEYYNGYERLFSSMLEKEYNRVYDDYLRNTKEYRKARELLSN